MHVLFRYLKMTIPMIRMTPKGQGKLNRVGYLPTEMESKVVLTDSGE